MSFPARASTLLLSLARTLDSDIRCLIVFSTVLCEREHNLPVASRSHFGHLEYHVYAAAMLDLLFAPRCVATPRELRASIGAHLKSSCIAGLREVTLHRLTKMVTFVFVAAGQCASQRGCIFRRFCERPQLQLCLAVSLHCDAVPAYGPADEASELSRASDAESHAVAGAHDDLDDTSVAVI